MKNVLIAILCLFGIIIHARGDYLSSVDLEKNHFFGEL